MPAEIQADLSGRFKLAVTISAYGNSISEEYPNLRANTWAEAATAGRLIAAWRGACLGRGGVVSSGVVSEIGRARKSKVIFNEPIRGTTGVHFGYAGSSANAASLNTLGTSVRIRFDTREGDHVTRAFLGPCDGFVNNFKWIEPNAQPGIFKLGDYVSDPGPTPAQPNGRLWDFSGASPSSAPPSGENWVSYQQAWGHLLRAIYLKTFYSLATVNDAGVITGRTQKNWWHLSYRDISGKSPGKSTGQ